MCWQGDRDIVGIITDLKTKKYTIRVNDLLKSEYKLNLKKNHYLKN